MNDVWRPLTEADAKEWIRTSQAAEAVDRTEEHAGEDEFADLVASSRIDLATGTVGVFRGERMLAWGAAWTQQQPHDLHQVSLDGVVDPEVRRTGIGRALLASLERLGRARHAATAPELPLELTVTCHGAGEAKAALLAAAGFTPIRWFFDMRCDLTEAPPVRPVPDGLRIAPYPADGEPVRVALNEFFAEHWGHHDYTPESWREYTGRHAHRPADSHVLLDAAGEIVALVNAQHFASDYAQTGVRELWIAQVGTRKSLRGKGAASALLTHTLAAARAAGYQRAALDVDADNPTGALGVYERCGFATTARWTFYGKRP